MKLELKYLTGYLPYKIRYAFWCAYAHENDYEDVLYWQTDEIDLLLNHSEYFLLLRPLSDLTKEIEVNGEKFIPLVELAGIEFKSCDYFEDYKFDIANSYPLGGDSFIEFQDQNDNSIQLLYSSFIGTFVFFNLTTRLTISPCLYNKEMVQKLLEWHFDIHGLIKEGLAIDINTLNK